MKDKLTIAFIKKNDTFVPAHVSEIKKGDHYYLVSDAIPSAHQIASTDAFLDKANQWTVESVEKSKP